MDKQFKFLGKVSLTAEGNWDRNREYEKLSIVTDETTGASYVSKKDVPAGIHISNSEYWQSFGSHTAIDNNFIVLSDKDEEGNLIVYDLNTAIATINVNDRNPGLILGFYGIDYSTEENNKTWFLYQFDADDVNDWFNLDKWISLYNNVNKFRGFFRSEEELNQYAIKPTVGDHAAVGKDMENAILYLCTENGKWTNTNTLAYTFANIYEAVGSRDFDDFDFRIEESYADRAEKDALGRIIHFTYITREGLSHFVIEKINNAIANIDLPEGSIEFKSLSKSLVDYINAVGNGGSVTNFPDEEDLTSVKVNDVDTLKLKDKVYSPTNYSGKGRKYLRKNMIDGINVLEPYMMTEPNTIYIVQYDYCMNNAVINIPEGCTIQFDGGTINGGTLVLNETKITGVLSVEEMGMNLIFSGTFKKGQQFFDDFLSKPMWWNGECWITLSDNNFTVELLDKLDNLPSKEALNEIIESKADNTSVEELKNELDTKASNDTISEINITLNKKVDLKEFEEIQNALTLKADKSEVNKVDDKYHDLSSLIVNKADISEINKLNNKINDKADITDLNDLANIVNNKADKTTVDQVKNDVNDKVDKGELTLVADRVVLLENGAYTFRESIADLKSNYATLQGSVNSKVNLTDFKTLEIEVKDKADKTVVNDLNNKTTTLQDKVTELKTSNTLTVNKLNQLENLTDSKVDSVSLREISLKLDGKVDKTAFEDLSTRTTSLSTKQIDLGNKQVELKEDLVTLRGNLNVNRDKIDDLEVKLTANTHTIQDLSGRTVSIENKLVQFGTPTVPDAGTVPNT